MMTRPAPAGTSGRGRIARKRTIALASLSTAERQALGRTLYAIHSEIFAGVSEERFLQHVLDPPAEWTLVQLYLDAGDAVIGYCAVHAYRRSVAGKTCTVIRAEAGLKPAFRGRSSTYSFGILCALREKLRHPLTPIWYLGTLVHTSSYHLFCKYFPLVYPSAGHETPGAVRDVAIELIESFGDKPVDPADPMVRDVGWITIETPQEVALTKRAELPDVAFYRRRNPGYRQGHGLVVLVPLSFGNIAAALARRLAEFALSPLRSRHSEL